MALSPRLQLRQSQALVMTPQLMQAIKLLQLSTLDLAAYVDAELERNPLLERADEGEPVQEHAADADADTGSYGDAEHEGADAAGFEADGWGGDEAPTAPALADDFGRIDEVIDRENGADNVFADGDAAGPERTAPESPAYSEWAGAKGGREDGDYNLEAFVESQATLADHLAEQLALAVNDPRRRMIGRYLIDLVDDAGYLSGDLAEVADKLGAPVADVVQTLAILQTFSPTGVCARNLKECLALQLKERDRFDPAMQALVDNLELLARREFAALRKVCGVDDEDIADMVAEIRRLNPKPGLAFGAAPIQPVVPDVFVRQGADGAWIVELNTDTLPKVLISQSYYTQVSKTAKSDGDKAFLANCLQTANWLTRALDQRAKTILKVASEIVRQQDAFLAHGVEFLRPLNLKTIADAISMHESTVSRVTANKYMATSRGIFELKYFFTSAISASDGGDAHSAEAVRHRIKQLIDAEPPKDVLSDDAIVEKLKEAGIDIARRTVAKYREAMRIPSSVQRRREKVAALAT
ncbi:MAG TPA: RNA polymerase factor sigma-54 [Xanthobacteraceae bacterium]|nr:RNA polymerase factor sigma-54 [Xanthobacteraceae bacterium]